MRHFLTLGFLPFDTVALRRIFGSVMHWFFGGAGGEMVQPDVRAMGQRVVMATVDLYVALASALRPTPSKSHYTFNLRDVGRVFQVGRGGQAVG